MVDLRFESRLEHFVSLKFLQTLAAEEQVPECVSYITLEQLEGIKKMTLLSRGRLSVQPVEPLVGPDEQSWSIYELIDFPCFERRFTMP